MAYAVEFKPSAARDFSKLPQSVQKKLVPKINALATHPRPPGVVRLSGSEDLYRIRTGDYRIVYEIRDAVLVVLIVKIGHRREIYRGL